MQTESGPIADLLWEVSAGNLHSPQIEKQIRDGGAQMPAFGDALTGDEIQQLVAYLSAKKKKPVKTGIASASAAN